MEHNVDHQKLWNPLKWKTVSSRTTPFLYHPDTTFDLRDMLVAAGQVDHRATGHSVNQSCKGRKLPVRMHCCDAEATLKVVLIYLLKCFEYLRDGTVRKMIDHCKTNLTTQRQKERNLVHKENVE
jgi:hypothetical protein